MAGANGGQNLTSRIDEKLAAAVLPDGERAALPDGDITPDAESCA